MCNTVDLGLGHEHVTPQELIKGRTALDLLLVSLVVWSRAHAEVFALCIAARVRYVASRKRHTRATDRAAIGAWGKGRRGGDGSGVQGRHSASRRGRHRRRRMAAVASVEGAGQRVAGGRQRERPRQTLQSCATTFARCGQRLLERGGGGSSGVGSSSSGFHGGGTDVLGAFERGSHSRRTQTHTVHKEGNDTIEYGEIGKP
mmetsp:Transcript_73342/g.172326  ORF Transcript_73342/g.172326 Transcript_73342/m.172326 type:complete len:202 (+) Transcript_73342:1647-2252(+)